MSAERHELKAEAEGWSLLKACEAGVLKGAKGAVLKTEALKRPERAGSVMVACEREYPIVVTTNGRYSLDQNLYRAVKGMSAAYLSVSASRCNDCFPNHGNFRKMLLEHSSPEEMLQTIHSPGLSSYDQWQVQLLALILQRAKVALYSEIPLTVPGARTSSRLRTLRPRSPRSCKTSARTPP